MNAENFAQYLKNPSQLYQISYQELKSLVLQYPYCLNLHYLLLLKSKMDQHKDLNPNLEKTAAYSINRKFLYKQLKAQDQEVAEAESFTINEDFLELKDLSILEEPISNNETTEERSKEAPIPDAAPFVMPPAASNSVSPILEVPDLEEEEHVAIENEVLAELESLKAAAKLDEQEPEEEVAPAVETTEVLHPLDLSTTSAFEEEQEEAVTPAIELEPRVEEDQMQPVQETVPMAKNKEKKKKKKHVNGKPTFTGWVEQFQSDLQSVQMSEIMEAKKRDEAKRLKKLKKKAAALKQQKKKKKKKSKKAKVSLIAQNSIQDNNSIASETLAKLLVKQEQYTRAIRIYERLLLKDPENEVYTTEVERIRSLI